jgi:hypothetical protein
VTSASMGVHVVAGACPSEGCPSRSASNPGRTDSGPRVSIEGGRRLSRVAHGADPAPEVSRGPGGSGASDAGAVTAAFGDDCIAMSRSRRAITSWPPAAKAWLARS